ncbi:MAG: hypothetical protein R3246_15500 [Acidimicrobiia bacterium]|nr:hypothetical protein [Acidimicrobiia bacterium]
MNTIPIPTPKRPRRPLSRIDLGILALHGLAATVMGVIGFFNVSEGWESLQRILVFMLVTLWFAGIVAMAYLARLIHNAWIRMAVLLGGPFIGIAALVVQAQT